MDVTAEEIGQLDRERMARARRMSPEQKLLAGPQLFALALESMRAGLRLQHPEVGESEIRAMVRERLARMREKDARPFYGTG